MTTRNEPQGMSKAYWSGTLRQMLGAGAPNAHGDVIPADATITSAVRCTGCGEPVGPDDPILVPADAEPDTPADVYHLGCGEDGR